MTLDELMAAAGELRTRIGGDAEVFMLTRQGYAPVQLQTSIGFADAKGTQPIPMVLIAPALSASPQ